MSWKVCVAFEMHESTELELLRVRITPLRKFLRRSETRKARF